MSWVAVHQIPWPPLPPYSISPALNSGLLIDASDEKISLGGYVWNADRATKNISRVGFRFGAVTKAGGSALTVSLQDYNLATAPGQPDEVQDQTVAIANADASFASNTWYRTGALSASRSTAFGALLSVVIEYDGAGRLGADSVIVSSLAAQTSGANNLNAALKTGGSWAGVGNIQMVVLEFDDGTFGTFVDALPFSTLTSSSFNSGSAADEIALELTVPAPLKVDGAWVLTNAIATSDFDIVLYDGTTPMVTVNVDASTLVATTVRTVRVAFTEQTLLPGHTYRLSLKPTTAGNVSLPDFGVASASHFQAWPVGTAATFASRVDGGAWTSVATRRPAIGLYVSAILAGMPASRVNLGM